MTRGRLLILKPDLTPYAVEDNILYFECSRAENTTGSFSCAMPMRSEFEAIGCDWVLELQRSFDDGATWVNDLHTLWFSRSIAIDVGAMSETILITGHDALGLLDRRIVAYLSAENPDSGINIPSCKNGPADDVIRQVVRENMTMRGGIIDVPSSEFAGSVWAPLSGVDNRLKRNMPRVTVQSDAHAAKTVTGEIAFTTVSEACRSLADLAIENGERILYDFVYDPTVRNLVFTVWVNRRGADLTKRVLFSTTAGNVSELKMVKDYSQETTWVHVGGEGQAKQKVVAGVMGDAFQRTPWYPIESYIDGSSTKSSLDLMTKKGMREINRRAARWIFAAKSVDRSGTLFGRDYGYGDVVTVQHRGQSSSCRIKSIRLRYDGGRESEVDVPLESEEIL